MSNTSQLPTHAWFGNLVDTNGMGLPDYHQKLVDAGRIVNVPTTAEMKDAVASSSKTLQDTLTKEFNDKIQALQAAFEKQVTEGLKTITKDELTAAQRKELEDKILDEVKALIQKAKDGILERVSP